MSDPPAAHWITLTAVSPIDDGFRGAYHRAALRADPLALPTSSCPRLSRASTSESPERKTWMAGTSPAMTIETARVPPLVTTGLDPVVHAERTIVSLSANANCEAAWIAGSSPAMTIHFTISSHRSRQSGFIEQIRSIFHLRDQCLMFFSRWIAAIAVVCCS